jgi:nucleotide-binding universal stress UspA family protein
LPAPESAVGVVSPIDTRAPKRLAHFYSIAGKATKTSLACRLLKERTSSGPSHGGSRFAGRTPAAPGRNHCGGEKIEVMNPSSTPKSPSSRPFTIVVATDFSVASGYAFEQAATVAWRIPSSVLHVVHVTDGGTSAERTKQLVGELRLYLEQKVKSGARPERAVAGIHVRAGRPAREIAQLASDVAADLIVVGTEKGPHLKQVFVGSVAERLLVAAPCPVFVAGPMPSARAEAHDPTIEPPCADCVATRARTGGASWWCARHAEHHLQAHSYSFQRDIPLRTHDSSVTPTGIDL